MSSEPMVHAVEKGTPVFVEEALACAQTLQSRKQSPACSNCLAPLSPLPEGLPPLQSLTTPTRPSAPAPCERAGCSERFCSEACSRAACASWHGVLCTGGLLASQPHHPLREFATQAAGSAEIFILAARSVASALAAARAAPGGLSPSSSAAAAAPLLALPWCGKPWWEVSAAAAAGTDPTRRRRLASVRRDQCEESHQLLAMGIAHACRLGDPAQCAPLLDFEFFARVCAALEGCLQHVTRTHPLAAYCAALVTAPRKDQRQALETLRPIVEEAAAAAERGGGGEGAARGGQKRKRREDGAEGGESSDGDSSSDDDDDDDDDESESSDDDGGDSGHDGDGADGPSATAARSPAARPAPAAATGATAAAATAAAGSGIRWLDAPERAAAAVAELAPRIFPDVCGVAVGSRCAALPHSCVPDVLVEAVPSGHSGQTSGQDGQGSPAAFPAGSRCLLSAVALRGVSAAETQGAGALTTAYVGVAEGAAERRAALRARGIAAECACARCRLDAAAGDGAAAGAVARAATSAGLSSAELHWLAKAFQGEGRYADAEALLRVLCSLGPADSEALHGVGVCMLAEGRWCKAHAWWAAAAVAAPGHAALAAIAAKDASYWPSGDAPALPAEAAPPAAAAVRTEPIPGGEVAAVARFWGARECEEAVRAAEAHAAARGGWATARHYSVPTTDIPLHSLRGLLPAFNAALRDRAAAALWAAFPETAGRKPRVHDAFLVKYHEAEQRHLPVHADESEFSLTVALNSRAEFDGGGTFFEAEAGGGGGKAVVPDVGEMVVFRGGSVRHGGEPVTRGVRYIIAVFLFLDNKPEETTKAAEDPCVAAPPAAQAAAAAPPEEGA